VPNEAMNLSGVFEESLLRSPASPSHAPQVIASVQRQNGHAYITDEPCPATLGVR